MASQLMSHAAKIPKWDKATLALITVTSAVVIALSVIAVFNPVYFLVLLLLPVAVWLLSTPVGRALIFIFGGLTLMGGESGLSATKASYLAIVAICVLWSLLRVRTIFVRLSPVDIRIVLAPCLLFAVVCAFAGVHGLLEGRPVTLVAQDAFTYFLIAVAPLIALDAATEARRSTVLAVTVAAGSLTAFSWAVWWLGLRGSGVGGLERFTLVSSLLGFAAFAVALVWAINAVKPTARIGWAVFAIAIPATFIVSGSRSMVVFALGFLGLLGSRKRGRIPLPALIALLAAVLLVLLASLPLISQVIPDGERILSRFTDTFARLATDDGISSDGSYVERSRAYAFSYAAFYESPAFGQGFGYVYPSVSGERLGDLKVDSPVLILAKLGVFGLIALIVLLFGIWRIARVARGSAPLRLGETAMKVTFFIVLGRLFFLAPTEDKGFAYAVVILMMFAFSSRVGEGGAGARDAQPSSFVRTALR